MTDSAGASPQIRAVQWLPARDVLPREADDFTPWLASNLDILAAAMGLESLEKVQTESLVGDYRLDILARGTERGGAEIPVCIENQYGGTDHRHLGQLITYLAKEGRGLAVWVVEDASAAHIAAVEFLNRTSDVSVGYMLVRTRFAHGPDGSYQVHFEPLARPNSFTKDRGRRRVDEGATTDTPTGRSKRKVFLDAVLPHLKPRVLEAGFGSLNVHATGNYIWVKWPNDVFVAPLGNGYMHLRVTRTSASVNVHINAFETREGNQAALDVLRDHYADLLEPLVGPDIEVDWHAGQGPESDRVSVIRNGTGYENGDPADIATWMASVANVWLGQFRQHPITNLVEQAQERLVRGGESPIDVG